MTQLHIVKDVGMKDHFIHPSKFLIPEEEDDGGGGGMAAAAIYPNVYVIQSCSL